MSKKKKDNIVLNRRTDFDASKPIDSQGEYMLEKIVVDTEEFDLPEKKAKLTDEQILVMAEKIKQSKYKNVDDMPIGSPEQAKAFLERSEYQNIPIANP